MMLISDVALKLKSGCLSHWLKPSELQYKLCMQHPQHLCNCVWLCFRCLYICWLHTKSECVNVCVIEGLCYS